MRKRLFFVVKQLNYIGSAELAAVSFTSYLNEEYDVFLYSLAEIENGKVNGCYKINPRVTIRSLGIPVEDINNSREYIKENIEKVSEFLSMSSRDDDVFVLFSDKLVDCFTKNVRKILIKGFSNVKNYDAFDSVIYLTKEEYDLDTSKNPELLQKASLFTPFVRFDHDEDFKFHGNRIMCVTRVDKDIEFAPVFDLAQALKDKELKFIISICGEGRDYEAVGRLATEKGLDDVIEFREVNEISKSYSEADLFFYYSSGNHYPLFLIEALSFSVPVVSVSRNTYSYDILSDVGVYVSNINDAADKIYNLLKDKIKLSKLKFESFEYSKRFIKDKSIGKLREIIESVINKYE